MLAVFEKTELQVLLRDFYELTGIRTVVFDAWGEDILSYPQERPRFCSLIRSTPLGREACWPATETPAGWPGGKRKRSCIRAMPDSSRSSLRSRPAERRSGTFAEPYRAGGADEAAEWDLVKKMLRALRDSRGAAPGGVYWTDAHPYRILQSAADLLLLAANAMYQARLARLAPDSIHARLSRFLERHLGEDLSGERICREFGISRTTLYKLSRELFGCGISGPYLAAADSGGRVASDGQRSHKRRDLPACRHPRLQLLFPNLPQADGDDPAQYRRKYAQSALASPLASLPGEENPSQD